MWTVHRKGKTNGTQIHAKMLSIIHMERNICDLKILIDGISISRKQNKTSFLNHPGMLTQPGFIRSG